METCRCARSRRTSHWRQRAPEQGHAFSRRHARLHRGVPPAMIRLPAQSQLFVSRNHSLTLPFSQGTGEPKPSTVLPASHRANPTPLLSASLLAPLNHLDKPDSHLTLCHPSACTSLVLRLRGYRYACESRIQRSTAPLLLGRR